LNGEGQMRAWRAGSVTYNNAFVNGTPLFSLPSPFLSSGTAAVQNVNGVDPDLKTPYTQQWNFTVERQVGSVGLRTSYAGSRSANLVYPANLNLPLPSTTPFTTPRRPNQRYNQTIWADNGGNGAYYSLEVAAQKKQRRNPTLSTGFTWAKDLADTQESGGGTTFAGRILQDPNNPRHREGKQRARGGPALVCLCALQPALRTVAVLLVQCPGDLLSAFCAAGKPLGPRWRRRVSTSRRLFAGLDPSVVPLVSRRTIWSLSVAGALEAFDKTRHIDSGREQPDASFREMPKQIPAGLIDRGGIPQEHREGRSAGQSL
jgi:hypothetical protein